MTDSHRTSRQVRNFQKRRNFQVAYDPIDAKRAIVRAYVLSPSMTMRPCWQVFAVAIIFLATPSVAEPSDGNRLFQPVQKLKPNPATAKAGYADGPFIVAFPASDR